MLTLHLAANDDCLHGGVPNIGTFKPMFDRAVGELIHFASTIE